MKSKVAMLISVLVAVFGVQSAAVADGEKSFNKILREVSVAPPNPADIFIRDGGTSVGPNKSQPKVIDQACLMDEQDYLVAERQVLAVWQDALGSQNLALLREVLSEDFETVSLAQSPKLTREFGGIQLFNLTSDKIDRGTDEMVNYVKSFSKIEDVEIVVNRVFSSRAMRSESLQMSGAVLSTVIDIRGIRAGKRTQDVIQAKVIISKAKTGAWKISRISHADIARLQMGRAPAFRETTAMVKGVQTHLRREAIRRGGYALAVEDLNEDGFPDLFLGNGGASQTLISDGKGGFAHQPSVFDQETFVKSAIFADFRNSGKRDLTMVRFSAVEGKTETARRSDIAFYEKSVDNSFKKSPAISDARLTDHAMPAAVGDFDRDGQVDLYVGFPGAKDFTFLGDVQHKEGNKIQGVYWNAGNLQFKADILAEIVRGQNSLVTNRQKIFPHSALAVDLNQDGWQDIIVMDDRGNLSPIYLNESGRKIFSQAAERIGIENYGYGMGVAVGDLDNDGILDMGMSNVNFVAHDRIQQSCLANWDNSFDRSLAPGLRLFKGSQDGRFTDITASSGLSWAGEGMAGLEFLDYNGDGLLDIFVTNGLWSGTSRAQDAGSLFVRAAKFSTGGERALQEVRHGKSQFMDLLANFKGDLLGLDKSIQARPSLAGFQRKRLFRNLGGGKFVDTAYLEGVDSIADGYTIARADLNRDGVVDMVLRNADPGSKDVAYSPIQTFVNQNPELNRHLTIKLVGKKSNRDAIGARVKVKAGKTTNLYPVIANNGCVQSENLIFAGLGKNKYADLEVLWPSGQAQKFKKVPAGNVIIEEGGGDFKVTSVAKESSVPR